MIQSGTYVKPKITCFFATQEEWEFYWQFPHHMPRNNGFWWQRTCPQYLWKGSIDGKCLTISIKYLSNVQVTLIVTMGFLFFHKFYCCLIPFFKLLASQPLTKLSKQLNFLAWLLKCKNRSRKQLKNWSRLIIWSNLFWRLLMPKSTMTFHC